MSELRDHIRGDFAMHSKMMADDLEAMTDDQMGKAYGGCARTPYDMVYEIQSQNERLLAQLRGQDPGAPDQTEGWVQAPAGFTGKDAVLSKFRGTVDEILKAYDACSDEQLNADIDFFGRPRPLLSIVGFNAKHTLYHDAQLNYCQTLDSDAEMHWKFG
jgi:hypothetical protein